MDCLRQQKDVHVDERETQAIEWQCARLINLYANLNDAGRWSAVAELYTLDGTMARPSAPDQWIKGRDAILKSFLSRPARATRHFCTNIVVEVESPMTARAESRILLFTGAAETGEGLPSLSGPPLVGEYRDRFVRTEEGWRFSERMGRLSFGA